MKRLAASAVVAGRANGFNEKSCQSLAGAVARYYGQAMQRFAEMALLDVWYYRVNADEVIEVFDRFARKSAKSARETISKADARTSQSTLEKLTEPVNGKRQIINNPPLIERLNNLLSEAQKEQITQQEVEKIWSEYVNSLPEERRRLLTRFRITDAALRVGGVGSVGTRCTISLLEGDAERDAIILQQKEAGPSALEAYLPRHHFTNQAQRVVMAQRIMQAASDIFLGWGQGTSTGITYYWRQLKDKKGSFDVSKLDNRGMATYLGVCAVCLARAHARSGGDAAAISGYLGTGTVFAEAISNFAVAYANQTERDYQALVTAVKDGRIVAKTGI